MHVELVSVRGVAWIQDGGRRGFAHHGVPPGGALCPERLAQANAAVGNAWDAPAIELWGTLAVRLAAGRRIWNGESAREDMAGGVVDCGGPSGGGVRYVAVEGGFDVPEVLGGRGTLPVAGIGGHEGRALRAADVLRLAEPAGRPVRVLPPVDLEGAIRFVADEMADASEVQALVDGAFEISSVSDRVGTRLTGARIATSRGRLPSAPMVRGAVQLPPDGTPIVLGPDHPTTGGHPLLGVVIRADQGRLGALPPRAAVRFQQVDLATARELWREQAARWR